MLMQTFNFWVITQKSKCKSILINLQIFTLTLGEFEKNIDVLYSFYYWIEHSKINKCL